MTWECVNLLNIWHWKIPPHLPCSPDWALLNFHPLPKIRKCCPKSALPDWLRCQSGVQAVSLPAASSLYHQGFDWSSTVTGASTGVATVAQYTAHVPISDTCATYCNLFILQIKNTVNLTCWLPLYIYFTKRICRIHFCTAVLWQRRWNCALHFLRDCVLVILPEEVYLWISSNNQELN